MTRRSRRLTERQRDVLDAILGYWSVTREACPGRYLARRLDMHHSTIQQHLVALYRKGWIEEPGAPATPRDRRRR